MLGDRVFPGTGITTDEDGDVWENLSIFKKMNKEIRLFVFISRDFSE